MLADQIDKLASLMKDEDLKKYAGEGFWNLMQAVIFFRPGFSSWGEQKCYRTCGSYADVFVLG